MSFFDAHTPVALNKAAGLLNTGRMDYVEIDVLLTHLLQRMKEMGLMQHLVFKGGTMLRKMVFGPGGRLSTDLDFTVRSREAIAPDDLALEIAGVFSDPYRGIRFEFDVNKGLGVTAGSCRANPKCMTNFTPKGHVIKIEVSYRADPVLTPLETLQIAQPYFKDLDFEPGHLPCLRLEEAIAEKIRASFQRGKIRDLHDLQQLRTTKFDPDIVRRLAVLKLWQSPEGASFEPFSHAAFVQRMQERLRKRTYDEGDLQGLLRKGQKVSMSAVIDEVAKTYSFLSRVTEDETKLAGDRDGKLGELAERHVAAIREDAEPRSEPPPR